MEPSKMALLGIQGLCGLIFLIFILLGWLSDGEGEGDTDAVVFFLMLSSPFACLILAIQWGKQPLYNEDKQYVKYGIAAVLAALFALYIIYISGEYQRFADEPTITVRDSTIDTLNLGKQKFACTWELSFQDEDEWTQAEQALYTNGSYNIFDIHDIVIGSQTLSSTSGCSTTPISFRNGETMHQKTWCEFDLSTYFNANSYMQYVSAGGMRPVWIVQLDLLPTSFIKNAVESGAHKLTQESSGITVACGNYNNLEGRSMFSQWPANGQTLEMMGDAHWEKTIDLSGDETTLFDITIMTKAEYGVVNKTQMYTAAYITFVFMGKSLTDLNSYLHVRQEISAYSYNTAVTAIVAAFNLLVAFFALFFKSTLPKLYMQDSEFEQFLKTDEGSFGKDSDKRGPTSSSNIEVEMNGGDKIHSPSAIEVTQE